MDSKSLIMLLILMMTSCVLFAFDSSEESAESDDPDYPEDEEMINGFLNSKQFNFFDEDEDELDDIKMPDHDAELELLNLKMQLKYNSRLMLRESFRKSNVDDETLEKETNSIRKLMTLLIKFADKLDIRMSRLKEVFAEFDKFVADDFGKSDSLLTKVVELIEKAGIIQEFRDAVLSMVAQAEKNIGSIHKITGIYKKKIVDDEGMAMGKLETLPSQYNSIASLYNEKSMSDSVIRSLDILKKDLSHNIKVEKSFITLSKVYIEEQQKLVTLGKKLWVNSQVDYSRDEDEEDEVEHIQLNRNPSNEDIMEQIREVGRTRQAISAFNQFTRKAEQKLNNTAKKLVKDEL